MMVSNAVNFLSIVHGNLRWRSILVNSVEEAVDQRVRISLATHAYETTVEEASLLQHLPDSRVAPVVGGMLR